MIKYPEVRVEKATDTWWRITQFADNGAFGMRAERTCQYFLLPDGKVYSWWRLKFSPPAGFVPVSSDMLDYEYDGTGAQRQSKGDATLPTEAVGAR